MAKWQMSRAAAGVVCGGAAWFSLGTLAVVGDRGSDSIAGLLPPWSWLAGFAVAGTALAHVAVNTPPALFLLPAIAIVPWTGFTASAALMWSGPLIAIVWSLVAIGIARDLSARQAFARYLDRAWVAFVVSLLVLASFAAWTRLPLSGDEPHYLVIASSLLHDGDVELANDYDQERYREFYAGSLEPRHTKYTSTGRHYPVHGLGTSVLVAPAFAIAGTIGARATILVVSALGAAFLWSAVRSVTGSPTASWFALALLGLQVPFATQSFSIYPDPPAAAVTSFSVWMLCRIERAERVSLLAVTLLGLTLSTLPWLHIRLSMVAAAFGASILVLVWRRRLDVNQLVWIFAAPVISAALWIASSYVMFESVNPLASLRHAGAFASVPMSVIGLLADQEFGLLPFAPGLVFGVVGAWNRSVPVTSLAGLAAIVGTLITTASHNWWGGTNSPARFLVPILPVLAFGAGSVWRDASQVIRRVGVASIVISGTLLLLGAVAGRGRYLVNIPDGRQSLFAWLSDSVDVAALLPAFFKAGNTPATEGLIAAAWILTGLGIVIALQRGQVSPPAPPGRGWVIVASGVVAWIAITSAITIAFTGRATTTGDRSQFALLTASARPSLPTGFAKRRLIDRDAALRQLSFRLPSEDTLAMVRTPQFPAGRYQLEFTPSVMMPSSVTVHMGRSAEPIWDLAVRDGVSEPFTVGSPLRTLIVTTADFSSASETPIRVRPLGLLRTSDPLAAPAQHVRRYGELVIYTADQLTTLDAEGFWLWAGRRTSFAVANADGTVPPLKLTLKSSGSAIDVRFTRRDWRADASLPANESTALSSPASDVIAWFDVEINGRRDPHGVWVVIAVQP